MAAVPVSAGSSGGDVDKDDKVVKVSNDPKDPNDVKGPKDLKVAGGASPSAAGAQSTAKPSVQSTSKPAARPQLTPEEQRKMMDDPKLNALLAALPGAKVTAIK